MLPDEEKKFECIGNGSPPDPCGQIKRKNAPPPFAQLKRRRVDENGDPVIDKYCWACHKLGHDQSCSICPRVFHQHCLGSSYKFNSEGVCSECLAVSVGGGSQRKYPRLKDVLLIAVDQVLKKKIMAVFDSWPEYLCDKLCHIIDIEVLIDKINGDIPFTTTAEFFGEVKWIYHNSCIEFGEESSDTSSAKKLIKYFKDELLDIEACPQCYFGIYSEENDDISFCNPCVPPHTLVWAKMKGFPYWPAKCLKIADGFADVRFFGTHDKSRIPVNKCYLMSKDCPNAKSIKQSKYVESMEELNLYLARHKAKCGSYNFAPEKTVPIQAEGRHHSKSRKKRERSKSRTKLVKPLEDQSSAGGNAYDGNELLYATTDDSDEENATSKTNVTENLSKDSNTEIPVRIAENTVQSVSDRPGTCTNKAVSILWTFTAEEGTSNENANVVIPPKSDLFSPEPSLTVSTVKAQETIVNNSVDSALVVEEIVEKVASNFNIPPEDTDASNVNFESADSAGNSSENESIPPVAEPPETSPEGLIILRDSSVPPVAESPERNPEGLIHLRDSPTLCEEPNSSLEPALEARLREDMELRNQIENLYSKMIHGVPQYHQVLSIRQELMLYASRYYMDKVEIFRTQIELHNTYDAKCFREITDCLHFMHGRIFDLQLELLKERELARERSSNAGNLIMSVKKNIIRDLSKFFEIRLAEKNRIIQEKDDAIGELTEKEKESAEIIKELRVENRTLRDEKEALQNENLVLQREIERLRNSALILGSQKNDELDELATTKNYERNAAVLEAKRTDWCCRCLRPAMIHCCLNTNYCGEECMRNDSSHAEVCTRPNRNECTIETYQSSRYERRTVRVSLPANGDGSFNCSNVVPWAHPVPAMINQDFTVIPDISMHLPSLQHTPLLSNLSTAHTSTKAKQRKNLRNSSKVLPMPTLTQGDDPSEFTTVASTSGEEFSTSLAKDKRKRCSSELSSSKSKTVKFPGATMINDPSGLQNPSTSSQLHNTGGKARKLSKSRNWKDYPGIGEFSAVPSQLHNLPAPSYMGASQSVRLPKSKKKINKTPPISSELTIATGPPEPYTVAESIACPSYIASVPPQDSVPAVDLPIRSKRKPKTTRK